MPLFESVSTIIAPESIITFDTATKLSNSLSVVASKIANANLDRKGFTIFNNLLAIMYLDTDNTVSTSSFMLRLPPNKFYEMPLPVYTGEIWAMIASGTGSVQIRELT